MPNQDGNGNPYLAPGEFSRDGLIQFLDSSWDGNGGFTVAVREMIGGFNSWIGGKPYVIRKARRFVRRCVPHPEDIEHVRLIRTYDYGGCMALVFKVSRIP